MSRESVGWPLALVLLLALGVAWLVMQPFVLLLGRGNTEES